MFLNSDGKRTSEQMTKQRLRQNATKLRDKTLFGGKIGGHKLRTGVFILLTLAHISLLFCVVSYFTTLFVCFIL